MSSTMSVTSSWHFSLTFNECCLYKWFQILSAHWLVICESGPLLLQNPTKTAAHSFRRLMRIQFYPFCLYSTHSCIFTPVMHSIVHILIVHLIPFEHRHFQLWGWSWAFLWHNTVPWRSFVNAICEHWLDRFCFWKRYYDLNSLVNP